MYQESYYSDFREVDGVTRPSKIVVNNDGKKFLDAEITDMEYVEAFDEGEFARP